MLDEFRKKRLRIAILYKNTTRKKNMHMQIFFIKKKKMERNVGQFVNVRGFVVSQKHFKAEF